MIRYVCAHCSHAWRTRGEPRTGITNGLYSYATLAAHLEEIVIGVPNDAS